eukprot:gene1803-2932_t
MCEGPLTLMDVYSGRLALEHDELGTRLSISREATTAIAYCNRAYVALMPCSVGDAPGPRPHEKAQAPVQDAPFHKAPECAPVRTEQPARAHPLPKAAAKAVQRAPTKSLPAKTAAQTHAPARPEPGTQASVKVPTREDIGAQRQRAFQQEFEAETAAWSGMGSKYKGRAEAKAKDAKEQGQAQMLDHKARSAPLPDARATTISEMATEDMDKMIGPAVCKEVPQPSVQQTTKSQPVAVLTNTLPAHQNQVKQTPSSTCQSQYSAGEEVLIHGLVSSPQLNHLKGKNLCQSNSGELGLDQLPHGGPPAGSPLQAGCKVLPDACNATRPNLDLDELLDEPTPESGPDPDVTQIPGAIPSGSGFATAASSSVPLSVEKPILLLADSSLLFWRQKNGQAFTDCVHQMLTQPDHTGAPPGPLRAAYLGASNNDEPAFYGIFTGAMQHAGITQCKHITAEPSDEDIAWLKASHLILLAGGDCRVGWKSFQEHGVDQILRDRYFAGAALVGVSAGAMQRGMYSWDDNCTGNPLPYSTLGLVPFLVGVHAKDNWDSLRSAVGSVGIMSTRGLGIPMGGGVFVHPDFSVEPLKNAAAEFVCSEHGMKESTLIPPDEPYDGRPMARVKGHRSEDVIEKYVSQDGAIRS